MVTDDDKRRILSEMRSILAHKDGWTKGKYAKDAEGYPVSSESPDCASRCILGAYDLARFRVAGITHDDELDSWFHARHLARFPDWSKANMDMPGPGLSLVATWNDDPATTHDDILAFLED